MTFLEMQIEVMRRLGEPLPPSVAQKYHKLPDVKDAINDGYETISEVTQWYEKSSTLNLMAGTLYYNLYDPAVLTGADIEPPLVPRAVWSDQNSRWMRQTTFRQLDNEVYPIWERSYGEPDYWLMRGASWMGFFPHYAAAGTLSHSLQWINIMYYLGLFFPRGSGTAVPGGTASLRHTAMPARLSADADTPGFIQDFHEGLVHYAIYDLLCQEREFKKASRYWGKYLDAQAALQSYVDHRATIARATQLGGGYFA